MLNDIVNQLTQENIEFRTKKPEEEITQEFYDPQQYTIRQQKKELLELYEISDQLQNKLKRQESINNQLLDTIKRQNSQLSSQQQSITEQQQLIQKEKSRILELQKYQAELEQQIIDIQKQSQKIIERENDQQRIEIHSSKAKYLTLNQNDSIDSKCNKPEIQNINNKQLNPLKNLLTTDQETETQPSQKCLFQKRQKLLLQSLEYQNYSDFEISVKNRYQSKNTNKKTELFDISEIIKPKYKKKPQDLDELYLYSHRYRNSSVDHYYEPPKQYRFNIKKTLISPLSQRNTDQKRIGLCIMMKKQN